MRTWRTLRRLAPWQVSHRLRLRLRSALRARAPAALRRDPSPAPELRAVRPLPGELLRPCPREAVRERARAAAGGRFTFLGTSRELGARPFPPPGDVSLLWAYHLEYMDYLVDLSLEGRWPEVERLAVARNSVDHDPGPAGLHPYTASRRATAWLEALSLGGGCARGALAEGAWRALERVLGNLEHDVGGNHLLENGLALSLGGGAFRGRKARRMLAHGARILRVGAREQVLGDGGHYELSPMYHARVLGVLAEGALALLRAGEPVRGETWGALSRMVSYLRGILGTDGELPLFGDTARDPFLRPARLADAVESLLPVPCAPVPAGDRDYPDSGLSVFEDLGGRHRLMLDAGPVCPPRLPAHGQADTFSITLEVDGLEMIVDPGLYEYRAGTMRDWCRSTRAHSTVEVAGEDSSEVWSSFRVGRRARVTERRWRPGDGRASLNGAHDGYRHRGVTHRRLVSHLAEGLWLVADTTLGRKPHAAASRLHLHPEAVVERTPGGGYRAHRRGRTLDLFPLPSLPVSWEKGWYCPEFGVRRETRILRLDAEGRRVRSGFLISAHPLDGTPARVEDGQIRVRVGRNEFVRCFP